MNTFGILCTSTQGKNSAEAPGHCGNDVIYTRSHWRLVWFEYMNNFGQYVHVK